MKRIACTALLAGMALLAVTGCKKISQNKSEVKPLGILTLLNLTQEESSELSKKRGLTEMLFTQDGYGEKKTEKSDWDFFLHHSSDYKDIDLPVVFFDSLSSMLMALESGKISEMEVPQSVGEYLCVSNSKLVMSLEFDKTALLNSFGQSVLDLTQGTDFSFMLLKKNEELRDTFNKALRDMKADGTLAKLESEYLSSEAIRAKIQPVTITKMPGAPVIKVAVTGDIPPLDYVSPDGTPAGFNTAVLSEVSRRIGKNIELVTIDAGARATALASSTVDVVFWTRSSSEAARIASITKGNKDDDRAFSEDEKYLLNKIEETHQWTSYAHSDIPDETIITEPYYHDYIVCVALKPKLDNK